MSGIVRLVDGTIFGGDYKVLNLLAEGGMGAVYVVEQQSTRRRRALKVMLPALVTDEKSRARFAQEATVASEIESDHVVEVLDAGVDESTAMPYLVMELLEGQTLATRVETEGALSVADVADVLRPIGHALGAAHRAGIVHRDLKPENIYLARTRRSDGSFTLKLLDFGIAKYTHAAATATGTQSIGSPLWMATEQLSLQHRITPRTDVWSLGLLTFWMLTGETYWRSPRTAGGTIQTLLTEVLIHPLDTASVRAAEVGAGERLPAWFDEWFARTVAREPEARFADGGEAVEAFARMKSTSAPAGSPLPEPMTTAASARAAIPVTADQSSAVASADIDRAKLAVPLVRTQPVAVDASSPRTDAQEAWTPAPITPTPVPLTSTTPLPIAQTTPTPIVRPVTASPTLSPTLRPARSRWMMVALGGIPLAALALVAVLFVTGAFDRNHGEAAPPETSHEPEGVVANAPEPVPVAPAQFDASACETAVAEGRLADANAAADEALARDPANAAARDCRALVDRRQSEEQAVARAQDQYAAADLDGAMATLDALPSESPFRSGPPMTTIRSAYVRSHLEAARNALRRNPTEGRRRATQILARSDLTAEERGEGERIVRDSEARAPAERPVETTEVEAPPPGEDPIEVCGREGFGEPMNRCIVRTVRPSGQRNLRALAMAYRGLGDRGNTCRTMRLYVDRYGSTQPANDFRNYMAINCH